MTVKYIYPQVGMRACQGSKYGEVTAVIADPAVPKVTNSADTGITVDDPNLAVCSLSAYRYVGAETTGINLAPMVGPWYRSQVIASAASVPSKRQQAEGQHWLACIAYLGASIGDPRASGDQELYDGLLRNALTTGQERNSIGTCSSGTDLDGPQVGCRTDHHSELFATTVNGDMAVPRSQLQDSCSQAIEKSNRMPDVVKRGLTIQMQATDHNGTPLTASSIPPYALLSCSVAAADGRTLNGSLLALGNDPIPWA